MRMMETISNHVLGNRFLSWPLSNGCLSTFDSNCVASSFLGLAHDLKWSPIYQTTL